MRVVVLGGGYAGLVVARELAGSLPEGTELVVVDEDGHHLVQHRLHRLLRRPELADAVRLRLDRLLEGATVRRSRVVGLDRETRRVALEDGELAYDLAAVCLGAETDFHGMDDVAEHATPFKRVAHALEVRREFRGLGAGDRVVVGGAGLAGVQVAGELAALGDARGTDVSVVLLEQRAAVAPGFPEAFQSAVAAALAEAGVSVRSGTRVAGADEAAVRLEDGGDLRYDQLVWTGGIAADDAVGRRPRVRATLALDERTFGAGDAVRVVDAEGALVPASAKTAVRQGHVAAENLRRVAAAGSGPRPRLERYTDDVPQWAVSVGDDAVASLGPTVVRGPVARAVETLAGSGYRSGGQLRAALSAVREAVGTGRRGG